MKPTHTLLHISDTHFVENDSKLYGSVDCDDNLRRMFASLENSDIFPDAIIFTGDLADAGQEQAYKRLRKIVEPVCERYEAELIWVMGNHDARPQFRAELLGTDANEVPVDYTVVVDGLRIIVLDTTVPGYHHGEVTTEQYEWLAEQLDTRAEYGTLLALHHPPIPTPLAPIELVELRGQERFVKALEGSDVRSILAGHLHYSTTSTIPGGIPVSVASATCYTQDLKIKHDRTRGVDAGQSCNLVEVYPDRVVHTVLPIDLGPTVAETTVESLEQFIEESRLRYQLENRQ